MAEYLGIDADSESDLLDIAKMAVAVPTPPGWQQIDSPDGSGMFRSIHTLQLVNRGTNVLHLGRPACLLCLPSVIVTVFCFARPACLLCLLCFPYLLYLPTFSA